MEVAIAATVMECIKCHTPLPDSSRYCFACGADQSGAGATGDQDSTPVELLQARLQRLVLGHYEIKSLLGKGGMGAVFLARDLALDREVAIKVLPPSLTNEPQFFKRFQQEARTAAKLDHSNIIPIYRVESEAGLNYFGMKYVSGTSLETVLESKRPLSYDYIQRILWEAACALGHAHSRGVVHRDVKPANIMFDHDGKVMLTDFGISKALEGASGLTGTGMIVGTPHYMSPEQAKGQTVDGRADQYSLGVVGYRMLTGLLPFTSDSVHNIIYKHIFEEAQRIATLRQDAPAHLINPIHQALSKDPDQRFRTMEEFATAVWPEQPVTVTGKTPPRPIPQRPAVDRKTEPVGTPSDGGAVTARTPSKPSSTRTKVLVALALLAVVAVGYMVLRPGMSESPSTAQITQPVVPPTQPPTQRPDSVMAESARIAGQTAPPAQNRSQSQTTRRQSGASQGESRTPPAPPQEEWGYLSINAEPFGTVFIDGVNRGTTPIDRLPVKPGAHTIRIENPGYRTRTDTVQVAPGNTIPKRYALIPEG